MIRIDRKYMLYLDKLEKVSDFNVQSLYITIIEMKLLPSALI